MTAACLNVLHLPAAAEHAVGVAARKSLSPDMILVTLMSGWSTMPKVTT